LYFAHNSTTVEKNKVKLYNSQHEGLFIIIKNGLIMDAIQSSIDFLVEVERLKGIFRKAKVKSNNNRRENSAEHSWHAAIAAQILKQFIVVDIDIDKVVQMLLIHDIVEIYAGDMFAFDDINAQQNQKLKENDAIEKLCSKFNLKQVHIFKSLWLEFEECKTNDSKYAKSVDRIVPLIQNMHNNGGSWSEFGTSKAQILKHNEFLKDVSTDLWMYLNSQIDIAVEKGWVSDEPPSDNV
jgi:putative hydrolases of HD superfamily